MLIRPKFIQAGYVEGNKVDLKQANIVLKYKPDIILFELPTGKLGADTVFNKYPADKKPIKAVHEIIKILKISAKNPYAISDIAIWENIQQLWKEDHNIYIYNLDTPKKLRNKYFQNLELKYPQAHKDWLFWVHLYLRDEYMANNVEYVLKNYKEKRNPIVAVFVQSIHWKHIRFLLTKPNNSAVWKYYFGRFPKLKKENIENEIKKRSPFLFDWWNQRKDFHKFNGKDS